MAKKTNKTNHVLNLLSGAEEQETQETAAPKEAEPKVQIVTPNEEDAVAADVQQLLEEELLQEEMALKEQKEKEQQMEAALAAEEEAEATDETESAADAGLSDVLPAIEETEPEASEEPEADTEAVAQEAETEAEPEPQEEPEPFTEATAAPEPKREEPEPPPYVLVNVMERLVDNKVDYYMDKFDVCRCARCRVDVKALALTHMESKYVVVDASGVSAFLSLYTNKFSSEVMFHLGKACMQVLENPRH